MTRMDFDRTTLGWVRKELDETLRQAAQALDEYSQDRSDRTRLRFCGNYLHQVYGTLQMLELEGAALLAEEIERLLEALMAGKVAEVDIAEETLMTSILRLSEVLERIHGGERDSAARHLNLINELRSTRGEGPMAQSALFRPDLAGAERQPRERDPAAPPLSEIARAHRHQYQRALLGVIRGQHLERSLAAMSDVLDLLDGAAQTGSQADLWWVAAGMVDALRAGGLTPDGDIKALLGQIDRQIRRVIEEGDTALQNNPPETLMRDLLYRVAQAGPVTDRLIAIRDHFGLHAAAPEEGDDAVDVGPGSEILASVSAAIREDVTSIKDVVDLHARGAQHDPARLEDAAGDLNRVADTLGMLGLGAPRRVAKEQAKVLASLAEGAEAGDQQYMNVARALLYVEAALDGLLRGDTTASTRDGERPGAETPDDQDLFDLEYRSVYRNAVQEAVADIGRVKEAIIRFIDGGDHASLQQLPELAARLQGALNMLDLSRAAGLFQEVGAYIEQHVLEARTIPDAEVLDPLADAITSLEYYLEAVLERRRGSDEILDVAEDSLAALQRLVDEPVAEERLAAEDSGLDWQEDAAAVDDTPEQPAESATAEAALDPGPSASAWETGDGSSTERVVATKAPDTEHAPEAQAPRPRTGAPGGVNLDVAIASDELDDEILEIFLEEVDEVMETLQQEYPRWKADPTNEDALATSRRMFHTLKGSGRLAGALLLGEVAWGNERLLNRIIDGQLQSSPAIHALMDRSILVIPQLVRQIKGEGEQDIDARALLLEADRLADPEHHAAQDAAEAAASTATPEPGFVESAADEALAEPTAAEDETASTEPEAEAPTPVAPDDGISDPVEPALIPAEAAASGDGLDESLELTSEDEDADESAVEPYDVAAAPSDDSALAADELPELEFDLEELSASESDPASDVDITVDAENPEAGTLAPVDGDADSFGEFSLDALEQPDEEEDSTQEHPQFADLPSAETTETESADAPEVQEASSTQPEPEHVAERDVDVPVSPEDEVVPALDPVLYEIFRNETADHLSVVRAYLERAQQDPEARAVESTLTRALHTLAGSARMAGVEAVADLGRSLELLGDERLEAGRPLDADDLAVLEDGAARIDALVEALGDSRQSLPSIADVLDRILERRKARATESTQPAAAPDTESRVDDDTGADQELVDLFLDEADDILQFLDGTLARWEDDTAQEASVAELQRSLHTLKGGARLARFETIGDLCHVLESLVVDVEAHRVPADDVFFGLLQASLERLAAMVEKARSGVAPEAADDVIDGIQELRGQGGSEIPQPAPTESAFGRDNELVEVFLEESTEILQAIEQTQQAWADDPANPRLVQDIQRALHTLKGGARMAGFTPMGDLAHAVETLLIGVSDGRVHAGSALFELLEQCHDRLHQMREHAAQGVAMVAPRDLFQHIEVLEQGREGSPKAPEPAPAAMEEHTAAEAPPVRAQSEQTAAPARQAGDVVRVRADLLDNLVNYAGEISIYRARLDQQVGAIGFNLAELDQTVSRLRAQLRTMEIETEAQILYRYERENEQLEEDFDPLELDRFSHLQELSRALSESVNDLVSIQSLLDNLSRESETLLLQQSRVNTELQDGLMRTRMVPFANLASRLRRIVRQTAQELGKKAQLKLQGAQGEMDRTVLERVTAPLEHMLRNAVAHGIETPAERLAAGKDEAGQITIALYREGADVVLRVTDDGAGLDLAAIRRKALDQGLMDESYALSDREVMQFVLEQGFSTARNVTQISGRGVGLDVVNSEIKQLGGTLDLDSRPGDGSRFTIRLPFTLAMNQALLCATGEQSYAIPLSSIDGVVRLTRDQLETYFDQGRDARYHYAGQDYRVTSLATLLGTGEPNLVSLGRRIPVVLVQTGEQRLAVQVDELLGNREIVVKSVGRQISSVPGIFGATILADGRVVLILDIGALARAGSATEEAPEQEVVQEDMDREPLIMVVDDSITMRKVATRLLERNHMQVVTAKDGVDAVARLQEQIPDAMLLDIEMPRMDGYELATHMRNDARLKEVPIIMITSRTGEKHRQRAMDIGVNRYIGKPYQEQDLLENLRELLSERDGRGR